MPSRRFRFVALFCALPLVAGQAEPAAPVDGVSPLPPEEAKHFAALLQAAEEYRGLKAKGAVTAGSLTLAALKAQMTQRTAPAGEEATAPELPALAAALQTFRPD